MRLQEIMSTDVIKTSPEVSIAEAAELMRTRGVHHLIVMDHKRVVGVLSSHDHGAGALVGDAMTARVVTAAPTTTVREAANLLRGRSVGCLPVLDGDELVGIVTVTDLLELIGRGVERPVGESTKWTMGRRPSRDPARR